MKPVQFLLAFMRGVMPERRAPKKPEPKPKPKAKREDRRAAMRRRYDELVVDMKHRYGFRVRRWRKSMSGCAWILLYADGRTQRMLEAPYPRSPLSCAIFLHEVGHHAIGLGVIKPRSLEEWRAWQWALTTMRELDLPIDMRTHRRVIRSMEYAVAKSLRRGVRRLPEELRDFGPKGHPLTRISRVMNPTGWAEAGRSSEGEGLPAAVHRSSAAAPAPPAHA